MVGERQICGAVSYAMTDCRIGENEDAMASSKNDTKYISDIKYIHIEHGKEHNLQVSDEICCEHDFMFPAYEKVMEAIAEIIDQSEAYNHVTCGKKQRSLLFQYSGNVILISAQRGGGKTRMMLSVSEVLSSLESGCSGKEISGHRYELCEHWKDGCHCGFLSCVENKVKDKFVGKKFLVADPISPAELEDKQSILYVILSRLYELIDFENLRGSCHKGVSQIKNEIYQVSSRCLSGINRIMRADAAADLSYLREVSDGMALREYFAQLVKTILTYKCECENGYIVLQIDDTDAQHRKAVEVLEDIRKYLLVPNLIILMSADVDMVEYELNEMYHRDFDRTHTDKPVINTLARNARKYIDKLVPPGNMIYLPRYDELAIKNPAGADIEDKDGKLFGSWKNGAGWNIQRTLLTLIYRKTGVVFVVPRTYFHNIIPRTFRGLNQLIYILANMKDTHGNPDMKDDHGNLDIEKKNLGAFKEYFVNTWIKARVIDLKDRNFLDEFVRLPYESQIKHACSYLNGRETGLYVAERDTRYKREILDHLLLNMQKNSAQDSDYSLLFAIRTLLTLDSHEVAIYEKMDYISEAEKFRLEILNDKPGLFTVFYDKYKDVNKYLEKVEDWSKPNDKSSEYIKYFVASHDVPFGSDDQYRSRLSDDSIVPFDDFEVPFDDSQLSYVMNIDISGIYNFILSDDCREYVEMWNKFCSEKSSIDIKLLRNYALLILSNADVLKRLKSCVINGKNIESKEPENQPAAEMENIVISWFVGLIDAVNKTLSDYVAGVVGEDSLKKMIEQADSFCESIKLQKKGRKSVKYISPIVRAVVKTIKANKEIMEKAKTHTVML